MSFESKSGVQNDVSSRRKRRVIFVTVGRKFIGQYDVGFSIVFWLEKAYAWVLRVVILNINYTN